MVWNLVAMAFSAIIVGMSVTMLRLLGHGNGILAGFRAVFITLAVTFLGILVLDVVHVLNLLDLSVYSQLRRLWGRGFIALGVSYCVRAYTRQGFRHPMKGYR